MQKMLFRRTIPKMPFKIESPCMWTWKEGEENVTKIMRVIQTRHRRRFKNGVRREEIQRIREKQHNLKRGEGKLWIRESIDTPDGKRVKTMEMTVKELYAHCVLLEGKNGIQRCPDYWKLKKTACIGIGGTGKMETIREALEQYCEKREEAKDLRCRINRDERRLEQIKREGMVSDTVKGTRKDGTFRPIENNWVSCTRAQNGRIHDKRRIEKLHILEDELLEAMNRVDDFINAIPRSDLRMMFRMYYLDDMTWIQVASGMNHSFPKRKYTDESCRKRHDRYLKEIEKKL